MLKFNKHPGSGYVYILCDSCSRKIRQKDAIQINDRYNTFNRLLVCDRCVEQTNEQVIPIFIKEKLVDDPKLLRPEPQDQFVTNTLSTIVPTAPQYVQAVPDPLTGNFIQVTWQGPSNCGDSGIIGYSIEVADPQLSAYTILTNNTNTTACYYADYTSVLTDQLSYQVAAINSAGIGAYSLPGFYPSQQVSQTINYLCCSQDNTVLCTSSGTPIVIHL